MDSISGDGDSARDLDVFTTSVSPSKRSNEKYR